MESARDEYRVLVITGPVDPDYGRLLKTALLYADRVDWLPAMMPSTSEMTSSLKWVTDRLTIGKNNPSETNQFYDNAFQIYRRGLQHHHVLLKEVESSGFKDVVLQTGAPTPYPWLNQVVEKGFFAVIQELMSRDMTAISAIVNEASVAFDSFQREWRTAGGQCAPDLASRIEHCAVVAVEQNHPYSRQVVPSENLKDLTGILVRKLYEVNLPAVNHLNLEQIMELRERTKDDLIPVRVEIVKFIGSLRKCFAEGIADPGKLVKEAEAIVNIEILPKVLEARRAIQAAEDARIKKTAGAAGVYLAGTGAAMLLGPPALLTSAGLVAAGAGILYDIFSSQDAHKRLDPISRVVGRLQSPTTI